MMRLLLNDMKKAYIYSRKLFNEFVSENFPNLVIPEKLAIISIGEPDTREHLLENSSNVLNLDFWDVNDYYLDGYEGITDEQATISYKFIKDNINKDFHIHCAAGVSRSQAFGRFLEDCFGYTVFSVGTNQPHPNTHVLCLLKRCWRKDVDI